MKIAKLLNYKQTAQSQPVPGSNQVRNSAGGYAWQRDPWTSLDRFLILGTEGGTYYVAERGLTMDAAQNLSELIKLDGLRVCSQIVEISSAGRAIKNTAAIFALAACASFGNDETRAAALAAVPKVCRTGTHLFQFAEECEGMRGWGRGLRKAIGQWYEQLDIESATYQAIKYQQRDGWSHRDLLRLAHPKPGNEAKRVLYKWIVDGEITGTNAKLEAFERLKAERDATKAAEVIREFRMPREAVPTELLRDPIIWEALLEEMPLTALIRNLATMTRVGLLTNGSKATEKVLADIGDTERLRKSRVHPIAVLLARATYSSGAGLRGSGTWVPVGRITDALDAAFVAAFANVVPSGKRFLLGVDVSGSMSWTLAGSSLSCCEGAAAMAMATVRSESDVTLMAFADTFRPLYITPQTSLTEALDMTRQLNFGATDCALPMLFALERKQPVDAFVVYTDNETWFGRVHPAQALAQYRQKMGIDAKLIVVGMTATQFSIADPSDRGMLDVAGFDASVPAAISAFLSE